MNPTYVYLKSKGEELWTVGFFRPDGQWEPESDHNSAREAAKRVHYLNGGNESTQNETLRSDAAFLRHYLANYVVHVAVKDDRGHDVNGFAAVQIPDWAVKQRLDDIDAALVKSE